MRRRWKWSLLALTLVVAATLGAICLPAAATATDYTPTATVTITALPSIPDDTTGWTESAYYLAWDDSSKSWESSWTTSAPSTAHWKATNDGGTWSVKSFYYNEGDLIELENVTFNEGWLSSGETSIMMVCLKTDFQTTSVSGKTAVRYTDSVQGLVYYVQANNWLQAVAKVGDKYYTDFDTAVDAANEHEADDWYLVLLAPVCVETGEDITILTPVYCCHDSRITVQANAKLTLIGKVADHTGALDTDPYRVIAENGATVEDGASNAIQAAYGATVASTGTYTVSETTLMVNEETYSDDASPVSVSGKFETITGTATGTDPKVSLKGDTTIMGGTVTVVDNKSESDASGATVTEYHKLTVSGGTVTTTCVFPRVSDADILTVSGGTVIVGTAYNADNTYITGTGTGAGNVTVNVGNAYISGTIDALTMTSSVSADQSAKVSLAGTANTASLTGAVKLSMVESGTVTTSVTGAADSSNRCPVLSGSANIPVQGAFASVVGTKTIVTGQDLSIQNASAATKIIGKSNASDLTLSGADSDYDVTKLTVSGTFGTITTKIPLDLTSDANLVGGLNVESATVNVSGATIGAEGSSGAANSSVKNGTLVITGSTTTIYSTISGPAYEYSAGYIHIADNVTGYPRLKGVWKQATGKAYTGGDLTINGTENTVGSTTYTALDLIGGCAYYSDDGLNHALTLNAQSATTVKLLAREDGSAPGFKSIEVSNSGNKNVNLSTASDVAVAIGGTTNTPKTALEVYGGSNTTVSLTTGDIRYGEAYVGTGVKVNSNPSVTLTAKTGGAKVELQTGSGSGFYGVYVDGGNFSMTGYTITATGSAQAGCGAQVRGATAKLKDITIEQSKTGLAVYSADVTLDGTISVTASKTAVEMAAGGSAYADRNTSLTSAVGSTGSFTATGNDSVALSQLTGTVTLTGYDFKAGNKAIDLTGTNSTVTLTGDATNNTIHGDATGIMIGSGTTATIENYNIYGANDTTIAGATSGGEGAKVIGTLNLEGSNTIEGYQKGLYVFGGTVTSETGSSGTITGGYGAGSATGLHVVGGTVTLTDYSITTNGTYGVQVDETATATVTLSGSEGSTTLPTISGKAGDGLCLNNASATVTLKNLTLTAGSNASAAGGTSTDPIYAANVKDGTLYLDENVTLGATNTDTNSIAGIHGGSNTSAKVYIINRDDFVIAEGEFNALTGKVTQRGDLTVINTTLPAGCSESYDDSLTIDGAAGNAGDLALGSGTIDATITDGSQFESVSVAGAGADASSATLTIAGALTISNSDQAYGLFAKNATVTFAGGAEKAIGITASENAAAALHAADNSKVYLAGNLTIEAANGTGILVESGAVVTSLKNGTAWVASIENNSEETLASYASAVSGDVKGITALKVNGKTAGSSDQTTTALLGELNYTATATTDSSNGVEASGDARIFLTAARYDASETADPTANRKISGSFGVKLTKLSQTGSIILRNYVVNASAGETISTYDDSKGALTILGGAVNTSTSTTVANAIRTPGVDVTVKNCTINATGLGIFANNVTLENTSVTSGKTAITADGNVTAKSTKEDGDTIESTTVGAISATTGTGTVTLENMTVKSGAGDSNAITCKTANLTNTSVTSTSSAGAAIYAGDVTATGCTVTGVKYGIACETANLTNTSVTSTSGTGDDAAAISARGNVTATSTDGTHKIEGGKNGIFIPGTSGTVTLTNMTVEGKNGAGISAANCDITATNCTVTSKGTAVYGKNITLGNTSATSSSGKAVSASGNVAATSTKEGGDKIEGKMGGIGATGASGTVALVKMTVTATDSSSTAIDALYRDITATNCTVMSKGIAVYGENITLENTTVTSTSGTAIVATGNVAATSTGGTKHTISGVRKGISIQSGEATGTKIELTNMTVTATAGTAIDAYGYDITATGCTIAATTEDASINAIFGKDITLTDTDVTLTANHRSCMAVYANGNVIAKSTGSAKHEIRGVGSGVYTNGGNIILENMSVTASMGTAVNAPIGNSTVTATNCTITATGTADAPTYGICARGDVTVSGGSKITVNLAAGVEESIALYGIYSSAGNVTANYNTITVTSDDDHCAYGIYAQTGNITATGNNITVTSTKEYSYGVWAVCGSVTLNSTNIETTGQHAAAAGEDATVTGGSLKGQVGLYAKGNVTLNGNATVTATGTDGTAIELDGATMTLESGTVNGTIAGNDAKPAKLYITKPLAEGDSYTVSGTFSNLYAAYTPAVEPDPVVEGDTGTPAAYPTIRLAGDTTIQGTQEPGTGTAGEELVSHPLSIAPNSKKLTVSGGAIVYTQGEFDELNSSDDAKIIPTGDMYIYGGEATLAEPETDQAIWLTVVSGKITSNIKKYSTIGVAAGTLTQKVSATAAGGVYLPGSGTLTVEEGRSIRLTSSTGEFKIGSATIIQTTSRCITGTTVTDSMFIQKLCDTGSTTHPGWYDKADKTQKKLEFPYKLTHDEDNPVTIVEKEIYVPATTKQSKFTVASGEGGSVSPDAAKFDEGTDVLFVITPDAGYRIADVLVDGESVGVTPRYTFRNVTGNHTIEAVFAPSIPVETIFDDIFDETWCRDEVQFVYDRGIMNGRTESLFMPSAVLNRGMFVTTLYRLEGSPAVEATSRFSDVTEETWCHDAIVWASENGIVNGYTDGTFRPTATVTRQQLVTFLWRYANLLNVDVSVGESTNILSFEDAANVSDYAVSAAQWACGEQLLRGANGRLNPTGDTTRGHAAAFLTRFIGLLTAQEK